MLFHPLGAGEGKGINSMGFIAFQAPEKALKFGLYRVQPQ